MEFSPSSECIDTEGFQDALSSIVCVCAVANCGYMVCGYVVGLVHACMRARMCACVCVCTQCACVYMSCVVCVCVLSKLHLHTTSQGHVDS